MARPSLATMARSGLLPTPMAKLDGAGADRNSPTLYTMARDGLLGDGLATAVGGKLNPQFVEWMMGFPLDWTAEPAAVDSKPSGTASSRRRRAQRS